jgi:proteasome lid subunit RPN8/RPN11
VNIARAVLDDLVGHAWESRPLECCGLLIGDDTHIVDSFRARNLAASATRYLIDPADHIRARRAARTRALEVVGFYHSHPKGKAVPSPRDILEASYREALWVIVGLRDDDDGGRTEPRASVRAFRIDGDRAIEVTLVGESEPRELL